MTENNITYAYIPDLEFPTLHRSCETCKHRDGDSAVDDYATCDCLIYVHKGWRLSFRDDDVRTPVAIVRTHKDYSCGLYERK